MGGNKKQKKKNTHNAKQSSQASKDKMASAQVVGSSCVDYAFAGPHG